MTSLLDVSVLVALFNSGHADHDVAHDWFADNQEQGWASCPVTENGLLRVLGNPNQGSAFIQIPQLAMNLRQFCTSTRHEFWPDTVSLCDDTLFDGTVILGPAQLTDVYLIGLAVKHRARFVTFDRTVVVKAVRGARPEHLEVISA